MNGATLFACGAVKTIVEHLDWPGTAPDIAYGTVGALRDRVLAGERPDVIVLSDAAMAALVARGLVAAEHVVPLGVAATGLALRHAATTRPIDTPAALAATLLAAESIGWAEGSSGATAGQHFERMIDALGIAVELRAKARLFRFGVDAVAACGRGEVELAVSQSTEIIGRPGVSYLGPLPPPYALATGYCLAPLVGSGQAAPLLAVLTGSAMGARLADIGFTPG